MKTSQRIFVWVALTAFSLLLATAPALAQDVMKVSPETHKVILENEHVRVLSVHLKPGEKVGMHSHPANVAYYLTDARVKVTHSDGTSEEHEVKAGSSAWSDATTHAAENIGTTELQEVQVEIKETARKP
jgi:quercetin dioxygenase-like cupin family protein